MVNKKEHKIRVSVAFDKDTLKIIDDYCKRTTLSRSSAISSLCLEMIEQRNFMRNFPQMMQLADLQQKGIE